MLPPIREKASIKIIKTLNLMRYFIAEMDYFVPQRGIFSKEPLA